MEYIQYLYKRLNSSKRTAFITRVEIEKMMEQLTLLLFPETCNELCHLKTNQADCLNALSIKLETFKNDFHIILKKVDRNLDADAICDRFLKELYPISESLLADANAILQFDPAAKSLEEVLHCYPGLYAIAAYRTSHFLYQQNIPILPRLMSEIAHSKTGIDIHPGAKIGKNFCIDHGTGVVIGETAIIGDDVKIYQGVTIGSLSVEKDHQNKKRHPTIEDGCIIYSNATILGGDTVIGKNSTIGGNVWLVKSIAPNSRIYHKAESIIDNK